MHKDIAAQDLQSIDREKAERSKESGIASSHDTRAFDFIPRRSRDSAARSRFGCSLI